jgi:histidinol-phosphate aminotransferase
LDRDQVIATNGGDELLRLALTTFVDPGRSVGVVTPSYGVYSVMSAIHQAHLSCVPLTAEWGLAPDTAARWNSDGAPLALITNPHAPSGALFSLATIDRLAAEFQGVLLVDEAYIDFVDPDLKHDATPLIAKHSNLVLLRTLSKGYGLAGLRLAYGLGRTGLIRPMLTKTKDSYNVDAVAQALGKAAILDQQYASASWKHVRQERIRVTRGLEDLRFQVAPSQTNFILTSPLSDVCLDAVSLYRELQKHGIYVRWFEDDRLGGSLRISIGNIDENNALLSCIGKLIAS